MLQLTHYAVMIMKGILIIKGYKSAIQMHQEKKNRILSIIQEYQHALKDSCVFLNFVLIVGR